MRTFTAEFTAYNYSELSDAAKERVQQQNNISAWEGDGIRENIRTAAAELFAEVGLTMTELYYDLNNQGGYPVFAVHGTIGNDFHVTTAVRRGYTQTDWYVGEDEYADDANPEAGETFIQALLDSIQADIWQIANAEDEYVSSDEYAEDLADANGYEYDEEGNLI